MRKLLFITLLLTATLNSFGQFVFGEPKKEARKELRESNFVKVRNSNLENTDRYIRGENEILLTYKYGIVNVYTLSFPLSNLGKNVKILNKSFIRVKENNRWRSGQYVIDLIVKDRGYIMIRRK